ncbi:hypothetical protein [Micromonospora maritima]|uniref:hypothetical protein n=1 Tax=Micromonospora maritima TaxID=986711 RepID=UPI00157BCA05|nr:hypothetical protein [Micromonospora maritima]
MEMEEGQLIRVWEHPGARRIRAWQSGHTSASDSLHVYVGRLPSGWWFAERASYARAYATEAVALEVAEVLKEVRDSWREVPAELGPDGRPTAPGWARRGGEWFREP